MMKYVYNLKIDCNGNDPDAITNVLEAEPARSDSCQWELELTESGEDSGTDFINQFLDILEGRYSLLEDMGIRCENISVWMYYEYDQQCNMEFLPEDLKRMGSHGISLCISCWQS